MHNVETTRTNRSEMKVTGLIEKETRKNDSLRFANEYFSIRKTSAMLLVSFHRPYSLNFVVIKLFSTEHSSNKIPVIFLNITFFVVFKV